VNCWSFLRTQEPIATGCGFVRDTSGVPYREIPQYGSRLNAGTTAERAAFCRERALDIGETALELGVGAAQCTFGIGADVAGEVDQREQQIAGFIRELFRIAAVQRRFDLVGLFADLGEHRARIVPVEPNGGRLALQFHCPRQCRLARLDVR
jgi:hypothetical protein